MYNHRKFIGIVLIIHIQRLSVNYTEALIHEVQGSGFLVDYICHCCIFCVFVLLIINEEIVNNHCLNFLFTTFMFVSYIKQKCIFIAI